VANTLKLFRNGAVGFIDWSDAGSTTPKKLGAILGNANVLDLRLFDAPLRIVFNDMKGIINVAAMFVATGNYLHAIIFSCEHPKNRFANCTVLRHQHFNGVNVCSGNAT
jgi:hypothetical protein